MPKPSDVDPKEPLTLSKFPVRLDATLCAPGEIWIEGPDGEAVRVWPEAEKYIDAVKGAKG